MRFPITVLRWVALGPAVLVSVVLTVVVCALLPPALGLCVFLTSVGLLVALASGRCERFAIVALTRSRVATEGELRVMSPVMTDLAGRGIAVEDVYVRRAHQAGAPRAIGSRAVVITPGLVDLICRGGVTHAEAAALLAHSIGRRHGTRPGREIAMLAATTPWRTVAAASRGVTRALAWLPFMRVGWALRGVIGVICVMQSVAEGRPAPGLFGGALIALTYLVPAAVRAIETQTELAADHVVAELGLGTALAGLLRRSGQPMSIQRLQRLENFRQPPGPRLHLARG